MILTGIFRTA